MSSIAGRVMDNIGGSTIHCASGSAKQSVANSARHNDTDSVGHSVDTNAKSSSNGFGEHNTTTSVSGPSKNGVAVRITDLAGEKSSLARSISHSIARTEEQIITRTDEHSDNRSSRQSVARNDRKSVARNCRQRGARSDKQSVARSDMKSVSRSDRQIVGRSKKNGTCGIEEHSTEASFYTDNGDNSITEANIHNNLDTFAKSDEQSMKKGVKALVEVLESKKIQREFGVKNACGNRSFAMHSSGDIICESRKQAMPQKNRFQYKGTTVEEDHRSRESKKNDPPEEVSRFSVTETIKDQICLKDEDLSRVKKSKKSVKSSTRGNILDPEETTKGLGNRMFNESNRIVRQLEPEDHSNDRSCCDRNNKSFVKDRAGGISVSRSYKFSGGNQSVKPQITVNELANHECAGKQSIISSRRIQSSTKASSVAGGALKNKYVENEPTVSSQQKQSNKKTSPISTGRQVKTTAESGNNKDLLQQDANITYIENEKDQIYSGSMSMDDEIDLDFVEKYDNAFNQFWEIYPEFFDRSIELIQNLKIAKLQKMLEITEQVECELDTHLKSSQQMKGSMVEDYQKRLSDASRKKAARTIQLQSDLSNFRQSSNVLEGKLTWEMLTMATSRAEKLNNVRQQLKYLKVDTKRESLSALLPDSADSQAIRDAMLAPAIPVDEQEEQIQQLEEDNEFLKTEVSVLVKKLVYQKSTAKKNAWVDSVLLRMDEKKLKKLKMRFQKKLGANF